MTFLLLVDIGSIAEENPFYCSIFALFGLMGIEVKSRGDAWIFSG
jgi:hypothetical protein